jgi:hypothetical protein
MHACAPTRERGIVLVYDLFVRVGTEAGELMRELVIGPTRDYRSLECELCRETGATLSRDTTSARSEGLEPQPSDP